MGRYDGYAWVYSPKAEKVTEEIKKDIGVKSEQLIKILKKQSTFANLATGTFQKIKLSPINA